MHYRWELDELEKFGLCPNLASSRNAYAATVQLLLRKTRKSKAAPGPFAYPESAVEASSRVPSLTW